ncbi:MULTISPECIES: HNH endonuclease [unclassified Streptomyces]|uniref:HNH endonuclease n=1 Tax=unclassified Streptomyces TaxID=2593676 RepID=UPI00067D405D|nr:MULTISPECIES: HNH endonuclease [unclassified Streptomyces]
MSGCTDRKPGSKRRRLLKTRLAERDGARCFYCATPFGPAPAFEGATLDHLVPRSQLHTWVQAALVLACGPCNEAKADTPPALLLRPETGRYGPGLVPVGGPNAQTPTRPDAQARTRVREAGPVGQGLVPVAV